MNHGSIAKKTKFMIYWEKNSKWICKTLSSSEYIELGRKIRIDCGQ